MITRFTTAPFEMVCKANNQRIDMSNYNNTIEMKDSKGHLLLFTNERITFNEDLSFSISLTPAETGILEGPSVRMDIVSKDTSGSVVATNKLTISLDTILSERIIYD